MTEPWDSGEAALVELLATTAAGSLSERLGITITSVSREQVVATMPVEGNRQPYGLLHGGASCALAESLASVGSALHGWPDRIAVGVDLNATHHRAVREGTVTGTATPLHLGRTVTTWDVVITDDAGRRVCTARVTCLLREAERPV